MKIKQLVQMVNAYQDLAYVMEELIVVMEVMRIIAGQEPEEVIFIKNQILNYMINFLFELCLIEGYSGRKNLKTYIDSGLKK